MIEELLFQKTLHDQVEDHISKKPYYECTNCNDLLRDGNWVVATRAQNCPRCGHYLLWARLSDIEIEERIHAMIKRKEYDARKKQRILEYGEKRKAEWKARRIAHLKIEFPE